MKMLAKILCGDPAYCAWLLRGFLAGRGRHGLTLGTALVIAAVASRSLPAETPSDPKTVEERGGEQLVVPQRSATGADGRGVHPFVCGISIDHGPGPVERGLAWLIEHQLDEGSWSFDLNDCPKCSGQCSHSGEVPDRPGATALSILAFLGRGYTHQDGPYKKQVHRGVAFLEARAERQNGAIYDPTNHQAMYEQGLAAMALAGCYGMTKDDRLLRPAQLALDHIMAVQNQRDGGWGYRPRDVGHTVAVGLQIMALRSGEIAGLEVDRQALQRAGDFLDFVQMASGAEYGDIDATRLDATSSAAGLLCRLFLGWKPDSPALQDGVRRLAGVGPGTDLLFDYYATQLMHHVERDAFVAWFDTMKPLLLKAQASEGHEAGSWHEGFRGTHPLFVGGGRLQSTALATMILEVYYRHLPLYQDASCPAKVEQEHPPQR